MNGLTPALARYLVEIRCGVERRSDLASRLSVAKPSVTKAIGRLDALGYVEEGVGRRLMVTERGAATADALVAASEAVERSLMSEGIPSSCARKLAEDGVLGGCACVDLARRVMIGA